MAGELELISEQLRHAMDLQKAQIETMRSQLDHDREINALKMEQIKKDLAAATTDTLDIENRLRDATAGVIQSRFFLGLLGGTALLAIAALVKAFFF
jgi:hypothetical protein